MNPSCRSILFILFLFFCLTVPIHCQNVVSLAEEGDIIARHPYIVSIRGLNQRNHLCSGVLLGQFSVLTAASCVDTRIGLSDRPTLYLNTTQSDTLEGVIIRETVETILHPNYTGNAIDGYNMAFLRLNASSAPLRPMRILPDNSNITTIDRTLMAVAYGRTSIGGARSVSLQVVLLNVLDPQRCIDSDIGYLEDQMFCVDNPLACSGDEGGPVFHGRSPESDSLFGIISGTACLESVGVAGVTSTATDETRAWLREVTGEWEPPVIVFGFDDNDLGDDADPPDAESPLADLFDYDFESDLENDL